MKTSPNEDGVCPLWPWRFCLSLFPPLLFSENLFVPFSPLLFFRVAGNNGRGDIAEPEARNSETSHQSCVSFCLPPPLSLSLSLSLSLAICNLSALATEPKAPKAIFLAEQPRWLSYLPSPSLQFSPLICLITSL